MTPEELDIQDAVDFAVDAHRHQYRKGSRLPYIVHPFAVLSLVQKWGVNSLPIWKACLCHDVLEERPDITADTLMGKIGREAAFYVSQLTFIPDLNSSVSVAEQKAQYMLSFQSKSIQTVVVKIGDRFHNTLDFYNSHPHYAPEYWAKANPLFEVFHSREQIIKDIFGSKVFKQMLDDKLEIDRLFM